MPNFSEAEITALVDGYEDHKLAIQAKTSGPHGSLAKQRAWAITTASLFAVSGVRRSVNEVKKKWTDYKSANKIRGAAVRRSQNATGGGPGEPELTDAEERVIGLLSEASLVGIERAFDIGARQLERHERTQVAADRDSKISPDFFVIDPGAGSSTAPQRSWSVHSSPSTSDGMLCNQSGGAVAEAVTSQPSVARPALARPASARPATPGPATPRPASARPASARPASAQPASARPAAVRAAAARAAVEIAASTPPTDRRSDNKDVGHEILQTQVAI
ncbi:hemocyte protein-glutamine gamma-glutamyltransferase-like [Ixodes scapularis]